MPGNKSTKRAISFTMPPAAYRVVLAADAAVDSLNPPAIPVVNNLYSVVAINELFIWLLPEAGVTATCELWAVLDGKWYFVSSFSLAVAGRAEVVYVPHVPASEMAIVVPTLAGGSLTIAVEHTA